MEFRYKALRIKQTTSDKMLALFAAPASEIDEWAGVPQKKRFGTGEETVGFQREQNESRVHSLGAFCANDENIIQNPLLCATRTVSVATVCFEPTPGEENEAQEGTLIINIPSYDDYSMLEILRLVREYIEARVPELSGKSPDEATIAELKALAAQHGHIQSDLEAAEDEVNEDSGYDEAGAGPEAALFEESHIMDFWREVAGRHKVIQLIEGAPPQDEFLGFTRSALTSYLRPVVLVDGQHRLLGALRAAEMRLSLDTIQTETENRIIAGESPEAVEADILKREVRRLPVSLLMTNDPAEQVFQFVVVNQKATPIGRALLGTIVSTTLSNDEMATVATRLSDAGIELEESQAVTFLARFPESPFCGLVERGLASDSKDLLQWGVFTHLISIFRNLNGGKLFGYRNDYAEAWKSRYLASSAIAAEHDNPFLYWRKIDGPWRQVFIAFFAKIRDDLGNTEVPDAPNYWGKPRESNLFNKISLTILAADFFQYLVLTKQTIDSADKISELVDGWLEGVNRTYFNRNWNLSGVKKDSTGIRNQWAYQWVEYRSNPVQLPQARVYRNPRSE